MMTYSMSSHKRKTHQRQINRICRAVNKNIAADSLWRGRFVVEQKATEMEWFEDKSGGLIYCLLQFRDKKTGTVTLWRANGLEIARGIYQKMNDFIVEDCKVWENENPYKEVRDYRNVC